MSPSRSEHPNQTAPPSIGSLGSLDPRQHRPGWRWCCLMGTVPAQWCKQIDTFLRNSGLAWPVYQVTLDSPLSVRLFYRCFVLGLGERQVSA